MVKQKRTTSIIQVSFGGTKGGSDALYRVPQLSRNKREKIKDIG